MTERRQMTKAPVPPPGKSLWTLARLEAELRIDRDGLDECVIMQPELYYHVASGHAMAVAERDALKLDFEQEEAKEGLSIRRAAAQIEEKLTEASLRDRLKTAKGLADLERDLQDAKAEAERWSALRDAYSQRSYMLRELVALHLSRLGGSSMGGAKAELADARHAQMGELRRNRGR